tara:strand:+ start:5930 stop:6832 length:903 start_codon:yes stop_codon:yes gene_type:complete
MVGLFGRLLGRGAKTGAGDALSAGGKFFAKNPGLVDDIILNPSMIKGLKWTKGGNKADLLAELTTKMDSQVLGKMSTYQGRLTKAAGKVDNGSYANLVIRQGEEVSTYSAKVIDDLGLPARYTKDLKGTMNNMMSEMWENGTKANAKAQIGAVDNVVAKVVRGGDDAIPIVSTAKGAGSSMLSKIVNGSVTFGKGAAKRPITSLVVLAGIGYVIGWELPFDIIGGIVRTLETLGFLPSGTSNGLIAMWGRLRNIITIVFCCGAIYVTYKVSSALFGVAKVAKDVVDTATDIVPDGEPTGA